MLVRNGQTRTTRKERMLEVTRQGKHGTGGQGGGAESDVYYCFVIVIFVFARSVINWTVVGQLS